MKKAGLLILSFFMILLTACGGGASTSSKPSETAKSTTQQPAPEKKQKITVWAYDYILKDNSPLLKAKDTFEQKNPGIQVDLQPVVYGTTSYRDKFVTTASGGTGPDVMISDVVWVPQLASMGLLMDVSDQAQGIRDQFFDGPLKTVTYKDKLYGLPWEASPMGIFYNKDAFKAVGLDPNNPPKTWDEFYAAAKKLTHDGKYGFSYMGGWGGSFDWLPFLWQAGGEVMDANYKHSTLNSPESIKSLEFFFGMVKEKLVPPAALTWKKWDELNAAFGAGLTGMFQSGPWSLGPLTDAKLPFEWGVFPSPKGQQQATVLGGMDWVINKNTKNPDASYKWMEFITNKENMAVLSSFSRISARKDNKDQSIFSDPNMKVFIESIGYAHARPPVPQFSQIDYDVLQPALLKIVQEGKPIKETMDEAVKKADEILSKN